MPEHTEIVPNRPKTPDVFPQRLRNKWLIILVVIVAVLIITFFTKTIIIDRLFPEQLPTASSAAPLASSTTGVMSVQSSTSTIQYLLFQSFWGGQYPNDGLTTDNDDQSPPIPWDQTTYQADLEHYVDTINQSLGTITLAPGKEYGFSVGPLTLEQTDQDLRDSIATAFTVALEKHVAVGLHFDISHYWRFLKDGNGTTLATLSGAQDVRAWQDWNGTIAAGDPWDGIGTLMPSMCFECSAVKAMVDYKANQVIGPALAAGIARLKAAGEEDLFAGAIIGWEAGTTNLIDYHSLTINGYSAAHPPADLDTAQEQVLNDYLTQWTSDLSAFVPYDKLYTHVTGLTKDPSSGNLVDAQWEAFTPNAQGGYSMYPNSSDSFQGIWSAAQAAHSHWGIAEGVDVMLGVGGSAVASPITWETYLGSIFNHGGTLANILGAYLPQPAGGFTTASESSEALAAYRKFLTGGTLVETKGAPSLSDKIQKVQSLAPAYIKAHPESVAQIQSLFAQIGADEKINDTAGMGKLLDQLLQMVGGQ